MASEAYEILAMFMRYIFVLIGALILFRAFRWMRRDARNYRREMKRLPDAGFVGEMVDMRSGKSQPLPREGLLGSSSACDIRVKGAGVHRRHALFSFVDGKGLLVTPVMRHRITMENVELTGPAYALHGTQLKIGECLLRVRLFAGLNVPNPRSFQMDMPMEQDGDTAETDIFPYPFGDTPAYDGDPSPLPGDTWPDSPQEGAPAPWTSPFAPEAYPAEAPVNPAVQPPAFGGIPDDTPNDEALPYQSPVVRHRRRDRL